MIKRSSFFLACSALLLSHSVTNAQYFVGTLGGGIPIGLISDVNSGMEDAWNTTANTLGSNGSEKIDKTFGGSFSCNLGFLKENVENKSSTWGMMFGYSYHGTGEAKWTNTYNGTDPTTGNNTSVTFNATMKRKLHEFRALPVLATMIGEGSMLLGGAGLHYTLDKYTQKQSTSIGYNFGLPPSADVEDNGFGFVAWASILFDQLGFEASYSTKNWFYIGILFNGRA